MKKIILLTTLLINGICYSQNQIFVSTTGNNSIGDGSISNPYSTIKYAGDQAMPGDTVFVRAGTYQNSDFGDNDIWTGEPVARLSNINGTAGNYITFIAYQNEQIVIEFDGIYGFLIQNSSYIKIQGFIFDGIADSITQQQAEDAWGLYKDTNGVIHDLEAEMGIDITDTSIIGTSINQPLSSDNTIEKPIEYNGRALVSNKSHHIEFIGNTIRNVPSAAIRAQQSDYITITKNKVYDNTFWTTQGVGAITISEATVRPSGDTYSGTKIIITENEVYQNENRLISWNPTKTFVHFEIDEGTGLFLTRNKDTYSHGEMLIANNLSYKNGASGIVCHHTNDVTIEHNTVFDNATTNHGNPGGIGVNVSDNVKILSNISYSKSNKWALGILAEPVTNLILDSNIVFNNSGSINVIRSTSSNPLTNGWREMNPLFTDENNYDFSLSNSSTAIDNASIQSGQTTDFFGNNRDTTPDIGAIEYNLIVGCSTSNGTDTKTECNSYTWIDGNTYTASNNTATFNIVGGAANSCDSLVTLDLTINSVSDITTTTSGVTISATNTGATYQWLDCDNNNAIITGETGQSYTVTINGNYAVELTENGCLDTSACVAFITVGVVENSFDDILKVYPNPTYGDFSIDLGAIYESSVVSITDISGKLIDSKTISLSQVLNLSIKGPVGIYIVSIQAGNKKAVIKLVKE